MELIAHAARLISHVSSVSAVGASGQRHTSGQRHRPAASQPRMVHNTLGRSDVQPELELSHPSHPSPARTEPRARGSPLILTPVNPLSRTRQQPSSTNKPARGPHSQSASPTVARLKMTVTELAILQFKEPLTEELKELLDYCQTVQDTWVLRQKPGLPPTRVARGTAILQQVEDPRKILLAAQWDSPQAHGEWIASPENQNVMAKLRPHIHVEGPASVLFFHIDTAIFTDAVAAEQSGTTEAGGQTAEAEDKVPAPTESKAEGKKKAEDAAPSLLTAPVLSVGRFGVRTARKDEFVKKYAEAKWVVEEHSKPYPVRGGWRIEKATEDLEEYIMYCGWSSVEQHKAIAEHEGFKEWAGIQEFVTGTDIWHYKRIM
ncbi:hypothetical protein C8034_v006083 [Colletotrichum sidae]|uniref:ABM domain-containing protein n=1 Tax=Colletotrichum sidae TaxID=1347389 RepID=A0A4R8TT54_9PEZI|nr:hypothetical protein C8034_v006083 [Colletotrichum sidae]